MRLIGSQALQLVGGVVPITSIGILLIVFPSLLDSKVIAFEPILLAAQSPSTRSQLLVDPRRGNDLSGNGSEAAPFKTITQALKVAKTNAVIQLAAGTYSAQTGEIFPIRLKPNTTIQGDPRNRGQGITIQGGGRFISPTSAAQSIAILGANQARLIGVTVSNLNRRGYGLWIESTNTVVMNNTFTGNSHDGISVVGSGAPTIHSNYFSGNRANGMTIYGTARPEIRANIFDKTGFGININQQAAPILIGNRITGNKDGIVVQAGAQPILRGNTIEGNSRDGLVVIAEARPNLGTANQPGNNIFRNNGRYGIHNAAKSQIISAFGNQSSDRTAGRIDLTGTAADSIANRPIPHRSPVSTTNRNSGNFVVEIPVEVVPTRTAPSPTQVARPSTLVTRRVSDQAIQPTRSSQSSTQDLLVPREAGVIEIPVPPPISQGRSTILTPPALPSSHSVYLSRINANLLPVPSAPIPLGHAGSSSAVFVARGTLSSLPGGPPPPPLKVPLGPRFRVVVEAEDVDQQTQIRSLVPDAFRSSYKGRAVMQVGSFKERTKADAMIHLMTNNGLNPIVELMQ